MRDNPKTINRSGVYVYNWFIQVKAVYETSSSICSCISLLIWLPLLPLINQMKFSVIGLHLLKELGCLITTEAAISCAPPFE